MKIHQRNDRWKLALVVMYVAAVAIRFVLAILTRRSISITIDEHLYTGLARSIACGDGLMFRGQTADYSYLTFPLFLSPVYALFPSGTYYFRVLQIWCIMLMQASVFPIYGIAERLIGERGKKPFIAAGLSLLLPDFIFGDVLFSECLIYPLFFTAVYLALREAKSPRLSNAVGIGLCAGLIYETKPGQVVFPVVFVLLAAVSAIRAKNRKALRNALISLLTGAAVIVLFRLAIGTASFGVYRKQLTTDSAHFDRFMYGCFLYPICFVLACGVGCFIRPLQKIREMSAPARIVFVASLVSCVAVSIGTSWVVNRYEYYSNQLHIRYIAMYIPIMLLYTFSALSGSREEKPGFSRSTAAVGLVLVLWTLAAFALPAFSRFQGKSISSYYAAFSILFLMSSAESAQWQQIMTVLVPASAAIMCVLLCFRKKVFGYLSIGLFVAIMLINNYIGYVDVSNSLANNETIYQSGRDVLDAIGDDEYIYVGTDFQYGAYNSLSVNSRQNDCYVLWTDMFNALNETGGVYRPFVPVHELRGTLQDRALMDTDLLVMDDTVYKMLETSKNTATFSTPKLYAIRIQPGERWVDSLIGNVIKYELNKGVPGILTILNEETLNSPIRIRLYVKCDQENAALRIISENDTAEVPLATGVQWVEVEFERPAATYNFISDDCMIYVYDYEVLNY